MLQKLLQDIEPPSIAIIVPSWPKAPFRCVNQFLDELFLTVICQSDGTT
jgi:hypothetical protein